MTWTYSVRSTGELTPRYLCKIYDDTGHYRDVVGGMTIRAAIRRGKRQARRVEHAGTVATGRFDETPS